MYVLAVLYSWYPLFDLLHHCYCTDVRYVDLARYKERPASSLRELFVAWRDAVAWRAPGILILDNLEAVLGAEAEVCHNSVSFTTLCTTEL